MYSKRIVIPLICAGCLAVGMLIGRLTVPSMLLDSHTSSAQRNPAEGTNKGAAEQRSLQREHAELLAETAQLRRQLASMQAKNQQMRTYLAKYAAALDEARAREMPPMANEELPEELGIQVAHAYAAAQRLRRRWPEGLPPENAPERAEYRMEASVVAACFTEIGISMPLLGKKPVEYRAAYQTSMLANVLGLDAATTATIHPILDNAYSRLANTPDTDNAAIHTDAVAQIRSSLKSSEVVQFDELFGADFLIDFMPDMTKAEPK